MWLPAVDERLHARPDDQRHPANGDCYFLLDVSHDCRRHVVDCGGHLCVYAHLESGVHVLDCGSQHGGCGQHRAREGKNTEKLHWCAGAGLVICGSGSVICGSGSHSLRGRPCIVAGVEGAGRSNINTATPSTLT